MLMQLYASISVTGSQKVKINSKFLIYIFNIFVFFAQGKLSADKHCSIRDFGSFQKKFAYFHLLLEVFSFRKQHQLLFPFCNHSTMRTAVCHSNALESIYRYTCNIFVWTIWCQIWGSKIFLSPYFLFRMSAQELQDQQ